MESAILADCIGKKYRLGSLQNSFPTLRESLSTALRGLIRAGKPPAAEETRTLWALRDVSFEIGEGEVVGFIGHNGAGKSTLLKILARITEPTTGEARVRGRLASLLEVGTGFHQELTGRENIFLNGAILGMKRREIAARFDEIVAFAEVERFIDTPVKHYSSGMYLRLAFSVAAHLEPDILLIDEVLAVGDAAFQKKCLGKMGDVAQAGRTVLFVSHNLGAVQALCRRALLLRQGTVVADDSASVVVARYLNDLDQAAGRDLASRTDRRGKGQVKITRVEVSSDEGIELGTLAVGRPARFDFYVSGVRPGMSCSFTLYDQFGQPVTFFDSTVHSMEDRADTSRGPAFACEIGEVMLVPGRYRVNAALSWNGELQDHLEAVTFVDVAQGVVRGRPVPADTGQAHVLMHHRWVKPC